MHRFALTASICAAVLLLSGCGGPSQGSPQDEPPITVKPFVVGAPLVLPVTPYFTPQADADAYFAAVGVAQQACAQEFGVNYTGGTVGDQPSMEDSATERRYGVTNLDEAEHYGYLPPPSPGDDSDDKAHGWNPSERELVVMQAQSSTGEAVTKDPVTGKKLPEHGCASRAFRDVAQGDDPPVMNPVVDDVLEQSWQLTMADSRAKAAEKKWAACMAKKGYDFDHRWDAGNSTSGKSQDVTIAMATLDTRCALDTGYLDVWWAVDTAYQERLLRERDADLQAVLADHRAVMKRVHDLLASGS